MKKIISFISVIVLVFALSACNGKNTLSNINTNTPKQSETFIKPENYASVLRISLNSQFNLYLDENNNVLVVEPVNNDAKSFFDSVDYKSGSFENVIGNIIEQANDMGFIKENTIVNFEIIKKNSEIDYNDILTKAVSVAQGKAKELNVEIKTQVKENTEDISNETSEPTSTDNTEKNSSKTATTANSKATTAKSTHMHNYSAATCTAPQKCSCGATKGTALGHKWQEATCKAPKTCSVCKVTEGNTGSHKYSNGKCIYCNKKQIIDPKTGLKKGADYYRVSADGNGYYTLIIWQFNGSIICPKGVYSDNAEWKESDETITYKGKVWYPVGSGGPLPRYYLTDTEIVLDFKNYTELPYDHEEYRLIVNHEYNLEVTYSSGPMFKKGDIFDLVQ